MLLQHPAAAGVPLTPQLPAGTGAATLPAGPATAAALPIRLPAGDQRSARSRVSPVCSPIPDIHTAVPAPCEMEDQPVQAMCETEDVERAVMMENLPKEFIALKLWKDGDEDEEEEEEEDANFWDKPGDFWTEKEKEECRRLDKYLKELKLVEKKSEEQDEHKRRAAWKPAEQDFLLEIRLMLDLKLMNIRERVHQNLLPLKQGRKEGVRAHNKLMAHFRHYFPDYHKFRCNWEKHRDSQFPWMAGNSYITFDDISALSPMKYTDYGMPRYVYNGSSSSLQIYSVRVDEDPVQPKKKRKVAGSSTQWPLQVFGVVAVRDSICPKRNPIFYRDRDNCQIITKENPFLELLGPTRAVGMNDDVMIEAELKVKGAVEREDKYLIACGGTILRGLYISDSVQLTSDEWTLSIEAGELLRCVEATIFIKSVNGTWPISYGGRFSAVTSSDPREIILPQFSGDSGVDGSMEQSRHVVSVQASGVLRVVLQAYEGGDVAMSKEVGFEAQMLGRSFCYVELCSCKLGVLVVWSRIQPRCGEMLPHSENAFVPGA